MIFDVLVIGSGPAGVQTLAGFAGKRLLLGLIDPGKVETQYSKLIPDKNFSEIRRSCRLQRRFFLGDKLEALKDWGTRLAAQMTPPRQYLLEGTRENFPFRSQTFNYFQTLAQGGLGSGWGAGVCTFNCAEMDEVGIDGTDMSLYYSKVARSIGVSLAPMDDTTSLVCELNPVQKPLKVDRNARALLEAYDKNRQGLNKAGFFLGRAPLAVLTEDREKNGIFRSAYPYHNMDYYSDSRGSVYRPAYTLRELLKEPGFEYFQGYLALNVTEREGLVSVICKPISAEETLILRARKVVLAAGALNTARLVAASYQVFGRKLPLLSNEVRFFPSINLSRVGRDPGIRKCSLAQLVGVLHGANQDRLISYLFSYESLLFFRLVREFPLPVGLGHLLAKAIVSSLTIATLHFPDRLTRLKWIRVLRPVAGKQLPELEADYGLTYREEERIIEAGERLKSHLFRLNAIPLRVINRGSGTAVHYGGTLPFEARGEPYVTCHLDGRLNGTKSIYIADSASWRFLPAKGPTLTIMANARRVAKEVVKTLVE